MYNKYHTSLRNNESLIPEIMTKTVIFTHQYIHSAHVSGSSQCSFKDIKTLTIVKEKIKLPNLQAGMIEYVKNSKGCVNYFIFRGARCKINIQK